MGALGGPEQQILRQKLGNNKIIGTCVFKAPFLPRGFGNGFTITATLLDLSPASSSECLSPFASCNHSHKSHYVTAPPKTLPYLPTALMGCVHTELGFTGPACIEPLLVSFPASLIPIILLAVLHGSHALSPIQISHMLLLLPGTFFSPISNPTPISKVQPKQNFLKDCVEDTGFSSLPLGSA